MHVVCSLRYSARHLVWHQELGNYLQVAQAATVIPSSTKLQAAEATSKGQIHYQPIHYPSLE